MDLAGSHLVEDTAAGRNLPVGMPVVGIVEVGIAEAALGCNILGSTC